MAISYKHLWSWIHDLHKHKLYSCSLKHMIYKYPWTLSQQLHNIGHGLQISMDIISTITQYLPWPTNIRGHYLNNYIIFAMTHRYPWTLSQQLHNICHDLQISMDIISTITYLPWPTNIHGHYLNNYMLLAMTYKYLWTRTDGWSTAIISSCLPSVKQTIKKGTTNIMWQLECKCITTIFDLRDFGHFIWWFSCILIWWRNTIWVWT